MRVEFTKANDEAAKCAAETSSYMNQMHRENTAVVNASKRVSKLAQEVTELEADLSKESRRCMDVHELNTDLQQQHETDANEMATIEEAHNETIERLSAGFDNAREEAVTCAVGRLDEGWREEHLEMMRHERTVVVKAVADASKFKLEFHRLRVESDEAIEDSAKRSAGATALSVEHAEMLRSEETAAVNARSTIFELMQQVSKWEANYSEEARRYKESSTQLHAELQQQLDTHFSDMATMQQEHDAEIEHFREGRRKAGEDAASTCQSQDVIAVQAAIQPKSDSAEATKQEPKAELQRQHGTHGNATSRVQMGHAENLGRQQVECTPAEDSTRRVVSVTQFGTPAATATSSSSSSCRNRSDSDNSTRHVAGVTKVPAAASSKSSSSSYSNDSL